MVGLDGGADEETAERDDRQPQAAGEVLVCEGVGVVVLRQDVQEAAVDVRLDVVELVDVCVLEPIDKHFRAEDQEEGAQDLADPVREDSEAEGENAGATDRGAGAWAGGGGNGRKAAEAVGLDDVAGRDDHEHEPELEALDHVGAGDLEQIVLFEFLEDGRFDFHELVGHEECEEGIGIGVNGDVEGDDLVEQGGGVEEIVE